MKSVLLWVVFIGVLATATTVQAAYWEDTEAREAIIKLRQRVDELTAVSDEAAIKNKDTVDSLRNKNKDTVDSLRNSMLDLQNKIQLLKSELANLFGLNEKLARDLSFLQRQQKDTIQNFDARIRPFEPSKVTLDGNEFIVKPQEKMDYEAALEVFRQGQFPSAENMLIDFMAKYKSSGYTTSALFWLGNARYANGKYLDALMDFRSLVSRDSKHIRAADSVLSIANCQIELKDLASAKSTFSDLIKNYPDSDAAKTAQERLQRSN